jgi:Heparinase II/III-like protein
MTIKLKRQFIIIIFLTGFLTWCKKDEKVIPEKKVVYQGILTNLKQDHPRLLLTDERLQELKTLSTTDSQLGKYVSAVITQADKDYAKSPIQHILIGPRLLDKSRECLNRVYNLAFAYRWTGNKLYLTAAVSNLKTVCAFEDWNPSHFLDVAEMTHAVAIGYDWLYKDMDQETRDIISTGLIKLGLEEGKKAYTVPSYSSGWWKTSTFNWNQVCNSGLLIGAIAIAEEDTTLASLIISNAVKYLPYSIKSYGPDGAWSEGPGYWDYATSYTAYGLSALDVAFGSTFGLTSIKGLSEAAWFPMYTAGPTGYFLNYADAGEKSKLGAPSESMWLASAFQNNSFSDFIEDQLKTRTAGVHHIIWYRPYTSSTNNRSLDKFFGGDVELFISRSSWTDPNALFLGVKAGYNKVNHGHLDLGNFEIDALGVRWARDLGSDDYNLPDYFTGTNQSSPRWTYYRLNSFSHNVPVLSNLNQDINGTSSFLKHSEGVAEPLAIVDFTSAYKDFASSARRGVKIIDNRKAILIQDEFILSKSSDISWGMTTDASIEIIDPQKAVLTMSGQKLTARILSPANAVFSLGSAEQLAPQKLNTGVKRLYAKTPAVLGNVTVIVLLSPNWSAVESTFIPIIKPLSSW